MGKMMDNITQEIATFVQMKETERQRYHKYHSANDILKFMTVSYTEKESC